MTVGYRMITELFVQKYEHYLPTAFNESMSLLQKVNKILEQLAVVIQNTNEFGDLVSDTVNTHITTVGNALQAQDVEIGQIQTDVAEFIVAVQDELIPMNLSITLDEWMANGKLATVINDNVFDMKANVNEVRYNTDVVPINVDEFDTETKMLMTGGSVAVVGLNAVGNENLKPVSVTYDKTTFAKQGRNKFNGIYTTEKRISGSTTLQFQPVGGSKSVIFEGVAGKTYTISQVGLKLFHIATFIGLPTSNPITLANRSLNGGSIYYKNFTVTLQTGETHILLSVSDDGSIPSELQIEEGSVVSSYTPPNKVIIALDDKSVTHNTLELESFKGKLTPAEMSFVRKGKNLWDETFLYGLRMGGPVPHTVTATVGSISLKFKGEKGKSYTFSKSTDTDWDGVMTLLTEPIQGAVGSRGLNGNGLTWGTFTVTLQGDEEWILISLSSGTQSIEPQWVQIEEGLNATNYVSPKAVFIELDLPMQDIGVNSVPKLTVTKVGDSIDIYVPSKTNPSRYIKHNYKRQIESSVMDTWLYHSAGLYTESGGNFTPQLLFSNGNSDNEGVLFVSGETDFIGGKHGYDYMESLSVIVDGKEMDMTTNFNTVCGFVKIVNKSRVIHDGSADLPENKAFTRYKVHTWSLDGMTMTGKWIAEHDMSLTSMKLCDFSIDQIVNDVTVSKWGRNDVDYIKHDISGLYDGETPRIQNVNTQEIWSDETPFYLALSCEYDKEKYTNHYTHVAHLGGTRSKIYFDFGTYSVVTGETINYKNTYDFRF